jgi:hypothetical protein
MGARTTFFAAYTVEECKRLVTIWTISCSRLVSQMSNTAQRVKEAGVSSHSASTRNAARRKPRIYDPCSPFSRLAVTKANFRQTCWTRGGLHIQPLRANSDDLGKLVESFEGTSASFCADEVAQSRRRAPHYESAITKSTRWMALYYIARNIRTTIYL